MHDIKHLVRLHVAPERVYDALTTSAGIRGWWTADADLDAGAGGRGTFRFYGGSSIIVVHIDALEPPRHVAWRTLSAFRPEWHGTTLTFDLARDGNDTVLHFAHCGFAEAGDTYALTTIGWGLYFVSLQLYLETGIGTPRTATSPAASTAVLQR